MISYARVRSTLRAISTTARGVTPGRRGVTRRQKIVLLIGVTLLGVAHASCARVQSHYVLPQLAVADPSFLPTLEAYTSRPTPATPWTCY